MKILIPLLEDCLVIYERFQRHILCFELNTVENCVVLERGFSKRLETKISKEKRTKKDRRTNIRNYIAADVHASWKKVKCRGLVFNGLGLHTT